jgi:hypothetical protein
MDAERPGIVLTDPKPLPRDTRCPNPTCRAGKEKRVKSAGFGSPHDVCSQCGYEWAELTV